MVTVIAGLCLCFVKTSVYRVGLHVRRHNSQTGDEGLMSLATKIIGLIFAEFIPVSFPTEDEACQH